MANRQEKRTIVRTSVRTKQWIYDVSIIHRNLHYFGAIGKKILVTLYAKSLQTKKHKSK